MPNLPVCLSGWLAGWRPSWLSSGANANFFRTIRFVRAANVACVPLALDQLAWMRRVARAPRAQERERNNVLRQVDPGRLVLVHLNALAPFAPLQPPGRPLACPLVSAQGHTTAARSAASSSTSRDWQLVDRLARSIIDHARPIGECLCARESTRLAGGLILRSGRLLRAPRRVALV